MFFKIASIKIAVKKRLSDGMKIGYHSALNNLYRLKLPFILNKKLIIRNIAPIIKI